MKAIQLNIMELVSENFRFTQTETVLNSDLI